MRQLLKRAAELCELDGEKGVLSVSYVGPRTIAKVNEEYVNHQGITDVISFDYRDTDDSIDDNDTLGDLLVCADVADQMGRELQDSDYARELVLYTIHGMLHLAGYDDLQPGPRKEMRQAENGVMNQLEKEFSFSEIFGEAPAHES